MRKTYKKWTKKEIDYIKENYGKVPIQMLINKSNHTKIAIYHLAIEQLNLHSVIGYHLYTQKEIKYLKENYGKILAKDIAKNLNRSEKEIRRKASKLHLKSNLKGMLGKKHSEKTKEIQAIKRRKWYINNPKKAILKAKKTGRFLKDKTWEEIFGKERAEIMKKNMTKRILGKKNMMYHREHSDITKKLQRKLANKRYSENPKIQKMISQSVQKLWRNPEYAKKTYKALQLKPTLPEKQIMQIIKLNNLPFNYVGDGKVILNGLCPDFLSKNPKHIIEVNGEYWHQDKNRERRKKKIYNSLGYKLLVIWSKEIKQNPQRVTEKIVRFWLK